MAIIVSKNGKGAVLLNKTPFGLEDKIQQYIYENPESIPLYDIKQDVQLLLLAREFSTQSGYIDAIGIDREGEIYLVETKLYKNPDKRTVVAQVLDYGASLWKSHPDFDSFLLQLNNSVQKTFNQTIRERIQAFYSIDESEVESIISNMSENLEEGNFKFVVLMDSIHDQLKDLILYMNQNSKFNIYGVELEYYKHNEYEIIIPKLYGTEVKKDLGSKKADNTFITDQQFISVYKSTDLEENIQEMFKVHQSLRSGELKFLGWAADRTPKNVNFFFKAPQRSKMSLVMSIGYNPKFPDQSFAFWLYDRSIEKKAISLINDCLKIPVNPLQPDAKYGVIAKWPVKEFSKDKILKFLSSLS